MRIAMTKQPIFLKTLSYEAFAAGTTSDVWFEEEEAHKSQPRKVLRSRPEEKWDA